MYRFVFLLALLILGGCRNRPTQFDPFLGKTTVPPPPTGSVGSSGANGLGYPASPPAFNAAPSTPSTIPPATTGGFTPSAPVPPPQPLSQNTPPGGSSSGANTPYQFTGGGSGIRVVPPDPNSRTSAGSAGGGIDIMQLPVKPAGNRPATPSGGSTSLPATQAGTPVVSAGNYGNDPAYSQLNGRLEYSSLDGRWLLRYSAPQSRPDRYGGVVVLVPQGSMAGFNNGDFVTAQGRLEANGSASPVFTAAALSSQSKVR